jgi:hypothetical protein
LTRSWPVPDLFLTRSGLKPTIKQCIQYENFSLKLYILFPYLWNECINKYIWLTYEQVLRQHTGQRFLTPIFGMFFFSSEDNCLTTFCWLKIN